MTKAAIIISAILVFAGVAAAGSLPGLSGGESNSPTIDTPTLATTTVEDDGQAGGTSAARATRPSTRTTRAAPASHRRRRRSRTTIRRRDISGPCDEAEHANDPRCTGVGAQAVTDDRGDGTATAGTAAPAVTTTTPATTTAATPVAAATPATAAVTTTTEPSPLPPRLVAQSSPEAAPPRGRFANERSVFQLPRSYFFRRSRRPVDYSHNPRPIPRGPARHV